MHRMLYIFTTQQSRWSEYIITNSDRVTGIGLERVRGIVHKKRRFEGSGPRRSWGVAWTELGCREKSCMPSYALIVGNEGMKTNPKAGSQRPAVPLPWTSELALASVGNVEGHFIDHRRSGSRRSRARRRLKRVNKRRESRSSEADC